jgi:diguanylate cyclase (GGDEF)-like protein
VPQFLVVGQIICTSVRSEMLQSRLYQELRSDRPLLAFALAVVLGVAVLGVALVCVAEPGWPRGAAVVGMLALLACTVRLCLLTIDRLVESGDERDTLEQSLLSFREAMDALPFGVAIYDEFDRLLMYNREAADQPWYRTGDAQLGQTFESIAREALRRGDVPDAMGREEEWLRERLAARGQLSRPLLRSRPDGRWMYFYEVSTPSGCLVMARLDVTELVKKTMALERSNEQLEKLSTTDGLTGLANRRQFDQHLYSEWHRSARSQQPLSLLLLDIDHFKRYNDYYGHLAGDACLRQVAGILFDCAQRSGEVVARYGGEEFAVLLPATDAEAAQKVARRCLDELAKSCVPHADSPVSEVLTASIGIATLVAHNDRVPEALVRCADEALYRAKSGGRGHFVMADCPEDGSLDDEGAAEAQDRD